MTSYPFFKTSRQRPRHRNSTSGFVSDDFAHLGRSKSTSRPNFGAYLHTRPIFTASLSEKNVCRVGILVPVSISTFLSSSACHSASDCQILSKSDHLRQSYDVVSIFQDGGHGITILLPVSFLVTSLN